MPNQEIILYIYRKQDFMKKPILFLTALLFILGSCSTEGAEKVADEFHKKLDEGKVDYIVEKLVDHEGSSDENLEEFREFLNGVVSMGEQTKRTKKTGFSKKYTDGVTTVKLSYTFEVADQLLHERLVLVERSEGYRLLIVTMHPDESFVDDFTEDY